VKQRRRVISLVLNWRWREKECKGHPYLVPSGKLYSLFFKSHGIGKLRDSQIIMESFTITGVSSPTKVWSVLVCSWYLFQLSTFFFMYHVNSFVSAFLLFLAGIFFEEFFGKTHHCLLILLLEYPHHLVRLFIFLYWTSHIFLFDWRKWDNKRRWWKLTTNLILFFIRGRKYKKGRITGENSKDRKRSWKIKEKWNQREVRVHNKKEERYESLYNKK
jgi:hypothetical protein